MLGNKKPWNPSCKREDHDMAVREFTTCERIVLSKWWTSMPRLRACKGHPSGVMHYIQGSTPDHDHMVSWRCRGAPLFTLAYRGGEVDALQGSSCIEGSRTVMFSHLTGECFSVREGFHLDPGDPKVIVQCITEVYRQREGEGYADLSRDELESRFGVGALGSMGGRAKTGVNGAGEPVDGDEEVRFMCMKVVDVDVEDVNARGRAAIMQELGRRWAREASKRSNRMGVMWCGDATGDQVRSMLDLRRGLRHEMECVVILTGDPYLQVHIPVGPAAECLSQSTWGAGGNDSFQIHRNLVPCKRPSSQQATPQQHVMLGRRIPGSEPDPHTSEPNARRPRTSTSSPMSQASVEGQRTPQRGDLLLCSLLR